MLVTEEDAVFERLLWRVTTAWADAGSVERCAMSVSEQGKQFAPVANYWSYRQFAISAEERTNRARRFRAHFSQENTPNSSALSTGANSVEFVMRGHAVILAATLAWFISIESADAKLDILVDKATQRMLRHPGRLHSLHVARIHRPRCHANPKRGLYSAAIGAQLVLHRVLRFADAFFDLLLQWLRDSRQLRDRSTWGTRIARMRAVASPSRRHPVRPGATRRSEPDDDRSNGPGTPCGAIIAQARVRCRDQA